MSCVYKTIAKIADLEAVQEAFGLRNESDWLNAVHMSISPTKEVLVFGHGAMLVCLGIDECTSSDDVPFYKISWLGTLKDENDVVTSILCLPLIEQSSSHTQTTPEWTCIIVGLSSGEMLFYDDHGLLLWSQTFYEEPVVAIRAQSGRNVDENVTVHHVNCVAILQGSQLIPTMRNLKQLRGKIPDDVDRQTFTIPSQRWLYDKDCGDIMDSIVVGAQKSGSFDHLLATSLADGFHAHYKATQPQTSLVVTVGIRPFVGFHYAKEGFAATELMDAAKAVANYLKSALPSWLASKSGGGSGGETEKPKPPPSMKCQFGLCDSHRSSCGVWLSPNKAIAAVADNLGRITIVDCYRGVAVRMFKGYRDAQCAFIEVKNDRVDRKPLANGKAAGRGRATFLLIFSPNRKMLEVWPMLKGKRVAAFEVAATGQLLYNFHTLAGVSSASKVRYSKSQSCLFFDPRERALKEICIPFHLALSGISSRISKDMHLLNALKQNAKHMTAENTDSFVAVIRDLVPQISTVKFTRSCVESLARTKNITPDCLEAAITSIDTTRAATSAASELDDELIALLENYQKLINLYRFVTLEQSAQPDNAAEMITFSDMELLNIQKLVDLSTLVATEGSPKKSSPKVTFVDECQEEGKGGKFPAFLAVFKLCEKASVALRGSATAAAVESAGETLFRPFLELNRPLVDFKQALTESSIKTEDLMRLLLGYWLVKPFQYPKVEDLVQDVTRFTAIVTVIGDVAGDKLRYDNRSINQWWQNVRELLLQNPNSLKSLLAGLMCRNVAKQQNRKSTETTGDDQEEEDELLFENVSQETCQWALLVDKLDDISVLSAILNGRAIEADKQVLPKLKQDIKPISLQLIVSGGRGIITELVAKWLTTTGIDPKLVLEKDDKDAALKERDAAGEGTSANGALKNYQLTAGDLMGNAASGDKSLKDVVATNVDPILHSFSIMRGNFPLSLESSRLIAHMAWEYLGHWSEHLNELQSLDAGISCLELVRDAQLRQDLCLMVWKAHIRIPLKAAKKLIFKAGRLPKEKLCLQSVGMSDAVLPEFIEKCQRFLQTYRDSIGVEAEPEPAAGAIRAKPTLRYEEILQANKKQQTLLEMASQQKAPITKLLDLHLQLVRALHMVAFFNIKSLPSMLNLYDQTGHHLFFADLTVEPTDDVVVTKPIRDRRQEFLHHMITANVEASLRLNSDNSPYLDDYKLWMGRIEYLAPVWTVNVMMMTIFEITELYAFGWDTVAEEVLVRFRQMENADTCMLSGFLLRIAAFRLHKLPNVAPIEKYSAYGTALTPYLDKVCVDTEWPKLRMNADEIDFERLLKLCRVVFDCMEQQQKFQLRIIGELHDACMTLRERQLV